MATTATKLSPSSLIICCFLLVMILRLSDIPQPLAARKLQDSTRPPQNDLYGEKKDAPSKSGVRRSRSYAAGSAQGNSTPSGGSVQMPPPTAVTSVTYANGNNPSSGNSNSGGQVRINNGGAGNYGSPGNSNNYGSPQYGGNTYYGSNNQPQGNNNGYYGTSTPAYGGYPSNNNQGNNGYSYSRTPGYGNGNGYGYSQPGYP